MWLDGIFAAEWARPRQDPTMVAKGDPLPVPQEVQCDRVQTCLNVVSLLVCRLKKWQQWQLVWHGPTAVWMLMSAVRFLSSVAVVCTYGPVLIRLRCPA